MPDPIRFSVRTPATHPAVADASAIAADRAAIAAKPKILTGHLQVALSDADGFARTSASDVTGTLSGTIRVEPAYVLGRLQDAIKSDAGKTITGIRFDARQGAYVVTGRVRLGGFHFLPGPSFTITLKPGPDGQFEVSAHSWADMLAHLFGRADSTQTLRAQLKQLEPRVGITERNGKFYLDILNGMTLPFGAFGGQVQLASLTGAPGFRSLGVDKTGGLAFTLNQARFTGGTRLATPTQAATTPDTANLALDFTLHTGNQVEARIAGNVDAHLDGDTIQRLLGANPQVLAPVGKGAHVKLEHLVVDGTYTDRTDWRSTTSADVDITTASGLRVKAPITGVVDGKTKASRLDADTATVSYPLTGDVKLGGVHASKDADDLKLQIAPGGETPFDPRPGTANNRLGLVIGGKQWEATLLDTIGRAKQYVHGETFDFSEGTETKKVITAMAERAAGIRTVNGKTVFDGQAIPIRVMEDGHGASDPGWAKRSADTLRGQGTEPWALALRQAIANGEGGYAGLTPAQRRQAIANLAANLDVREVPGGALRTDHRKVWVADGGFGLTGGMNLDDCMLSGIHDVMVPTIGPAVHDLADAWTRNWQELGGKLPAGERPLDASRIPAAGKPFEDLVDTGAHDVQVLVTDEHQTEIGQAMVQAIDGAQSRIRLEHAYFTDDKVVDALASALRRGVEVDVTVPEIAFEPFNTGNRAKLLDLLEVAKAPGAGKLNISFFQQNGDYRFHNHLKALTVDGMALLVGSGNIDQRGLEGSLQGDGNRLLFNRELDYRITDPAYVARFDHEVFDHDQRPGDTKTLYTKVAEQWAYPALAEGNQTRQRFHDQGPAAATRWLLDNLQASSETALGNASERVPGAGLAARLRTPAAQRQVLDAQRAAFAALETQLDAARAQRDAAVKAYATNPAGAKAQIDASVKAQADRIAAQLPEGQARTIALDAIDHTRVALEDALAKARPGETPTWFVEELEGAIAAEAARAATLAGRDRLATLMAQAPAATWDTEIHHALAPNAADTANHETFSFLF